MLRRVAMAIASGFMPRDPTHRGGALFLIGAGCSRSAGVPLGWEVAGIACAMMAEKLAPADRRAQFELSSDLSKNEVIFEEALKFLKEKALLNSDTSLESGYSHIFEHLFSDQSQQNEVISKALDFGRNQINWAHICLGQLVHERHVHTVLTTNFDTLILDGIVRCGTIPAVSDSLDTINRIRGKSPHPQLVHLHGSRHAYSQLNKGADTSETTDRDDLKQMIAELLRDSTALVVVGYAGGEEAVMKHVIEAVKRYPDKPIFWVTKGNNLAAQSKRTKELLEHGDAARRPRFFMGGWDADDFFRALTQKLKISLPDWMLDPVQFWLSRAQKIVKPSNVVGAYEDTITSLIDDYTKRLQQLKDCQAQAVTDAPTEIAEKIRQYIAAGNISKVWREIDAVRHPESYQDVLIELLHFTAEVAKSSGNHNLMKRVLWCIDQVHQRIDKGGLNWISTAKALDEIYETFRSFSLNVYPTDIRSHAVKSAKAGVQLRTKLAEELPSHFITALADGYHQLSNRLTDINDTQSALESAHIAVDIYQKLATKHPEYESDLANNLSNLSICLANHGKISEALDATKRAVEIRRVLVARNPAHFRPGYASSLNNLSAYLAELGDEEGALDAIRQAVDVYRTLGAENPARFNPDLAISLNNLSNRLANQSNPKAALDAIQEAVAIHRELAAENPTRFEPDLAMSLHNLSLRLGALGDVSKALTAIRQAVDIRRVHFSDNPTRLGPDLANGLAIFAGLLFQTNERSQAIKLMEEAITLLGPRAQAYPTSLANRQLVQMQADLARFRSTPSPSTPTPP